MDQTPGFRSQSLKKPSPHCIEVKDYFFIFLVTFFNTPLIAIHAFHEIFPPQEMNF